MTRGAVPRFRDYSTGEGCCIILEAAISPDGSDVYVTYNAFLGPWRSDLTDVRAFQGVVRHADFADLRSWSTLVRGNAGDARASSANSLTSEFLGDYSFIVATDDGAVAVWNDARDAIICRENAKNGFANGAGMHRRYQRKVCRS